jgi:hypothetical protein
MFRLCGTRFSEVPVDEHLLDALQPGQHALVQAADAQVFRCAISALAMR